MVGRDIAKKGSKVHRIRAARRYQICVLYNNVGMWRWDGDEHWKWETYCLADQIVPFIRK